jgi:hypothetical protein
MPTIVQQSHVSQAIRSLSTLERQDYVDLFTVTTDADGSPEDWARAGIDEAAGLGGQFAWRVVLGLRLESRSSTDHIAGWEVVERSDSFIVLEAASWCLTAQIVVAVDRAQVSVATFIRYDLPVAALVWGPVSVIHRRAMPGLLRSAVTIRQADRAAKVG